MTTRGLVIACVLAIVVAIAAHFLAYLADGPTLGVLIIVRRAAIVVAVVAGIWAAARKINKD